MRPPVVLTIAGSDPSGGAGLQADLRTFTAVGVAGLSVVTALTVQNSRGVQAVHPVAAEIVVAQLEAVLSDTRPDAVKIGMLGGAAQVRAVADAVRRFKLSHVVLDPVLASTDGVPLLNEAGRAALIDELLPLCLLITPNQDEWKQLPGLAGQTVLVKGGHLDGPPIDTLYWADGRDVVFDGARIDTTHTHGTGCFLSSAIAGYLARGFGLEDAIRQAKRLLSDALHSPVVVGQGRGYPYTGKRPSPAPLDIAGVYVLTDTHLRPDRSAEDITQAALAGGAKYIQLRDKERPTPELIALARRLTELCHAAGAFLIVNDRVDVALASEADGVHLGPDDMHPADARELLGPNKIIGISVSTASEAKGRAEWASYLGVGAIYGTSTKSDAGAAIGVGRIGEIRAAYPSLPIVAIGGINLTNIAEVAGAGANAAAVVSAVVCAPDMTAATADLVSAFAAGRLLCHGAD